jgi:flagellar biogenesis protein FliO
MAIAPLASILVVLGMLAGVLWGLKRLGIAAPSSRLARGPSVRLESLAKLNLGPQHNLHLVRADRNLVLVACSPSGCALLSHWEAAGADSATAGGDPRRIGVSGASR